MGVTALNRRAFCFAILPLAAVADDSSDRTDITEMFGAVAASLSEDNPLAAMRWFEASMPGRAVLLRSLTALVEKYEVSSAISILSFEGSSLVLDWFLELKLRGSTEPVDRRRSNVSCDVAKKGKRWCITKMEPISFLSEGGIR